MSDTLSPHCREALALAARGYHVLVLAEGSKIPPKGSRGLDDATADAEKLKQFFAGNPRGNLAINCEASRVVAIDIDVGHPGAIDGRATMAALTAELGPLPQTVEAVTARGGTHLLFAAPAGSEFRGNLGPGVDIRHNAYIACAPSIWSETGTGWRWIRSPLSEMPAELPAAWLARMAKPAAPVATTPASFKPSVAGGTPWGNKGRADELETLRTAPVSTRNRMANKVAFNLAQLHAGGELPDVREEIFAACVANGLVADPDDGERKTRNSIESGWSAGLKKPRSAPPKPDRPGPTSSSKPAPVVDITSAEPWADPEPLPDGLPAVPAFDEHLLPDSLRSWLLDISERLQCPIEYSAAAALVAMGAIVGRKCAMRPKQKDAWTVLCNIWGGVVAPPAGMKSPAINAALAPLYRLVADAAAVYARESQNREARQALREARQNAIRKKMAQAIKDGASTSVLEDEFTAAASETEVQEHRYILNDATTEKTGEVLIANPNGLLAFRDELSGWLATMDRQGHEGDRAFYLESWDGDHGFTVDRIGRGTQHIPALCLSVFGGIQPGRLAPYLSSAIRGGQGDDGLIQRFQVLVYPDPPRSWRNVDRWPDSAARNRAFETFKHLDLLTPALAGATTEEGELPFLRFDGTAQDLFNGWLADLMTRLRAGEEHPTIEGHLSKYRKLMPALALLFHLADGGQGPVTLASTQRAAAWSDLLESHARRIYASVVAERLRAARALLGKLRSGKLTSPFTARTIYRASWAGLDDRETVEEALVTLTDHGWVRPVTRETATRAFVEYVAHPSTLTHPADVSVLSVSERRDSQKSEPSEESTRARAHASKGPFEDM